MPGGRTVDLDGDAGALQVLDEGLLDQRPLLRPCGLPCRGAASRGGRRRLSPLERRPRLPGSEPSRSTAYGRTRSVGPSPGVHADVELAPQAHRERQENQRGDGELRSRQPPHQHEGLHLNQRQHRREDQAGQRGLGKVEQHRCERHEGQDRDPGKDPAPVGCGHPITGWGTSATTTGLPFPRQTARRRGYGWSSRCPGPRSVFAGGASASAATRDQRGQELLGAVVPRASAPGAGSRTAGRPAWRLRCGSSFRSGRPPGRRAGCVRTCRAAMPW